MPINTLPPAPLPTDSIADFDTKAFALAAALEPFRTEANTLLSQAETAAANAVNAPGVTGTSTTSLLIGTGSKALTIETGKSFAVGMIVTIYNTPTPTNWMQGNITAFTASTGALTVNVTSTSGSGTLAAWTVKPVPTTLKGLQSIAVPAAAMRPRITNGPSSAVIETATNKVMLQGLNFDPAVIEYAQISFSMPKSWNLGVVYAIPFWYAASGSGDVVWAFQGVGFGDNATLDAAFGAEQISTDTLTTANTLRIGPITPAITIAGTLSANSMVALQVKRNATAAGDTLAVDATLIGFLLLYTLNADTDA